MNFLHCCLAAVLLAVAANAAVDVDKTVKQVQSILQGNSLLPRLTRDEILELLNDIRAEDAKSTSTSKEDKSIEISTTSIQYSSVENEISSPTQPPNIDENIIINNNENLPVASSLPILESTTNKPGPSVMVVLPYTPRDGSSLQELYTRPPRVERIPLVEATPKPTNFLSVNKLQETLTQNAKLAEKKKQDFPAELQAFLDAHGLTGKPGHDHFLLPLEGFKPLPPARVVDGNVQLPENILLTYDLISPNDDLTTGANERAALSPSNFLYEPLRPELPFELDTSSSETKEQVYPFDMPKIRKTKSADTLAPNYAPIDYESVKVIPLPLKTGISPIEDINTNSGNEQSKRQTNSTSETTTTKVLETTTVTEEPKSASTKAPVDSASADTDSGPSVADLEDSFGGPLPDEPGDSVLPPPRKNGFYWMVDWNSFLEVGDGDSKVNIRFEPKLGDPQMFLPVSVP